MGEKLSEVTVNGRRIRAGMEITLSKAAGRRRGRYRFDWAEHDHTGQLVLNVYGPVRARRAIPHYRCVSLSAVETVHSKTKGNV